MSLDQTPLLRYYSFSHQVYSFLWFGTQSRCYQSKKQIQYMTDGVLLRETLREAELDQYR